MLKSQFLTALRTLRRNWTYSTINLVGLTLGLTCCLILFLAIRYELSYDRHHKNADRIYRMVAASTGTEGDNRGVGTGAA